MYFFHLRRLGAAGLVESEALKGGGRGRPRVVYRARPLADAAAEFRLLAGALTEALASLPDGSARAEAAGYELGRALMSEPVRGEETVERIKGLLERQGFEPEWSGHEILMRRCPFLDLVLVDGKHAAVVCGLHRGIVAGGLNGMASPLELDAFQPFVTPAACLVSFARREGTTQAT